MTIRKMTLMFYSSLNPFDVKGCGQSYVFEIALYGWEMIALSTGDGKRNVYSLHHVDEDSLLDLESHTGRAHSQCSNVS